MSGAREVFERAIVIFPPDRARPLWEKWARYEYQYGNFERVRKLEKRIIDVYPNGRDLDVIDDYDPTAEHSSLRSTHQTFCTAMRLSGKL